MLKKLKCINALELKVLAMALMLCDHMWATVLPDIGWISNLGRLAFPIFAFQIVEGFYQTHDRKKYIRRMLVFALISEIPFDLMTSGVWFYPFHQNVMMTFLIGLLMLSWMERVRGTLWKYLLVSAACAALSIVLGSIVMADYFQFGLLTVLLFYWTRNWKYGWVIQLAGMIWIHGIYMGSLELTMHLFGQTFVIPQQGLAVLSLIPIWMYNGKQGYHSKPVQYACYAFYPVHMLILYFLRQILM